MNVRQTEDRFGKQCICFPKSASINDVHDYLNRTYQGYQFAIVLDESKDGFEEYDEICVNFLNDLADEAIEANSDMYAVTGREKRMISKFLKEHGTSWAEVIGGGWR